MNLGSARYLSASISATRKLLIGTHVLICAALLLGQASSNPDRLSADTPKTTVLGNSFIAPKDWSIRVQGPATILEAPEGGSAIAIIDVKAANADEALATGWKVYKPEPSGH